MRQWLIAYVETNEYSKQNVLHTTLSANSEDEALGRFERLFPDCALQDIHEQG